MTKRIYVPTSKYVGNTTVPRAVKQWEWTPGRGLYVLYKDGLRFKSEYTLRELLHSSRPEGSIRRNK